MFCFSFILPLKTWLNHKDWLVSRNQENKELTIKFMHLCLGSEGKFQWPTEEEKTKVDIKCVIFVPLPPVSKNNNRTFEFAGTECIQVFYEKFKERYFVYTDDDLIGTKTICGIQCRRTHV